MTSFKKNVQAVNEDCILQALNKNWWDLATKLTLYANENDIKFSNAVRNKATEKKKRVEKLVTTFDTRPVVTTESPAF